MPERALGLLGGTFDPVHFGHLRLAEEARSALGLERVLWLPSGQPPHRPAPRAPSDHRLAMVRLAIEGNPGFALDAAEAQSAATSYTVTTLERLRQLHGPSRPLVLLLGADAFSGFASWHRWLDLLALTHLAVATRPGHPLEPRFLPAELQGEFQARLVHDAQALSQSPAGAILTFNITALEISGTWIRGALASVGSARYLLPDPVLDYIAKHRLYQ